VPAGWAGFFLDQVFKGEAFDADAGNAHADADFLVSWMGAR